MLTNLLLILGFLALLVAIEFVRIWWIERHTQLEWDDGPATWFDDHDDFKGVGK